MNREAHDPAGDVPGEQLVAEQSAYVHAARYPAADQERTPKSDTSTAWFRDYLRRTDSTVRMFENGELSREDAWYFFECHQSVLAYNLGRIMTRRLDSIEEQAAARAAADETAEAPAGTEPP